MNSNDIIDNLSLDKKTNNSLNNEKLLKSSILSEKEIYFSDLKKDFLNQSKKYNDNIDKLEKRLQKKINITYNFFLEKYFLSILPVIDSIDAATNLLNNSDKDASDIQNKLNNIQKIFSLIFEKYKISVINSVNIPFNPDFHQAISIDFSKKYKNNYIACIIQKGYLLHNRLLRPALVSVSQTR